MTLLLSNLKAWNKFDEYLNFSPIIVSPFLILDNVINTGFKKAE